MLYGIETTVYDIEYVLLCYLMLYHVVLHCNCVEKHGDVLYPVVIILRQNKHENMWLCDFALCYMLLNYLISALSECNTTARTTATTCRPKEPLGLHCQLVSQSRQPRRVSGYAEVVSCNVYRLLGGQERGCLRRGLYDSHPGTSLALPFLA